MKPANAYLALALTALFWSGNVLTGRALNTTVAPAVLAFWRWALVLLVLLPLVAGELRARAADLRRAWRTMALLGLLSTSVFNALIFEALRYTSAANAALLNSSIPVWTVIAAWLIARERTSPAQALGLAVSFVGVFTILSRGDFATLARLSINHGDALMMGAMVMWSIYAVCLRQRPAGLSAFAYLWVTGAFGLVMLSPWLAYSLASGASLWLPAAAWGGVVYLAVFPSMLATALYNRAVDSLGASRASQGVHLVPVFAALLGALLLDEPIRAYHLAGFALILAGLAWAAYFTRNQALMAPEPVR
ncbi:MAG TPA: DMT family transporter [Burkholderiales bacterium]|nr:DMT family transporter [Burkholderiales bacterium]